MTQPPEGLKLRPLIGRLAPSPTGVLHLGNARSLLLAWLSIRSGGGQLWLRIEDIDGPRVRSGAIESCLEDLQWLGLDWDGDVQIQSERLSRHQQVLDDLLDAGLAYPCVCTRSEVEEAASAPHESSDADAPVYPGSCRGRWSSEQQATAETGRNCAIRLAVNEDAIPFEDRFAGRCEGQIHGDFVIRKRDGTPAYQLAVVVDDIDSGVTEVLRADDLLPSTPRQMLIYRHLGAESPRFTHVPLVVGPDRRRLAKRHGDTSLARYRREGVTPETIIGALAHSIGWVEEGTRCRAQDLLDGFLDGFDLSSLPHEPMIWSDDRLR
ncbi:MAG: tRNA glutamyl-Q(34) synthetase GluQRS [Planctomycetota bacterium]|nr:tRNA glutamyl-Q(34) synthetase GluQRS [Planctomycetota bacterium]